jgi:hypothetical protein
MGKKFGKRIGRMKWKMNKRDLVYAALAVSIVALVIVGIVLRKDAKRAKPGTVQNAVIRSEGGGGMPVPTEEPTERIRNILICKNEFEGLRSRAEKLGTKDMLTLNSNFAGSGVCEFVVRSMRSIGNSGTIRIAASPEQKDFTVTLEFSGTQQDWSSLWSEAALLYLSDQISEETAAEAVKTAFETGSVSTDLFSINVRDSANFDGTAVTPVKVIEISGSLTALQALD